MDVEREIKDVARSPVSFIIYLYNNDTIHNRMYICIKPVSKLTSITQIAYQTNNSNQTQI